MGTPPCIRPLSEFEALFQVFADKAMNSIILSSPESAYTKLQSVIRDLDTRRHQASVEAERFWRSRSIGSDRSGPTLFR